MCIIPGITTAQTEKIWDEIGGKKDVIIGRLAELYNEPIKALLGIDDNGEAEAKNSNFTVDM